MRRLAGLLLLLLSVAALPALAGCGSDDDSGGDGGTIKLGSVFSTTGIGAPFGPQQVRGAELAAQKINEEGGIDGGEIEIVQRDDGSDPQRARRAMRELMEEEGVVAVLGPTFSNAAAAADPLADELGTPVLAVSNTGPGIVGECPYPCELVFRDSLGEDAAIPANVESLLGSAEGEGVERALVVHPVDDPFGSSSAETAAAAFEAGDVVVDEAELDSPRALRSPQGDPDAMFIAASSGEFAADAIRAARAGGFKGPILGGNALNSTTAAERAGAAGKGARSASAWFAGNDSEENREFIEAYRDAYGEDPDQFAAQAYTGVLLLAAAAEKAGIGEGSGEPDSGALADALAAVKLETPLGEFSFDADHDVEQPIWIVAMDGRGGYELIERVDP